MAGAFLDRWFRGGGELLASARWAFALAWRCNRGFLLGRIFVAFMGGLVPAALALVIRGLVNAVVEAGQGGPPAASAVVPWLLGGLAVTLVDVLGKLFDRYAVARFEDEFELDVTVRVMEHADRLDLSYFESPRFRDTLERAQHNTTFHLLGVLASGLTLLTHTLQIASLTSILLVLEPLALLVLLPFAFAHFLFQWRISKRHYEDERSRSTKRRWSRYFTSLVTTREAVPETKLLDLCPGVTRRVRELLTEFRDRNRERHLRSFVLGSGFALLTTLAVYFLFGRLVTRVIEGALSVGDIAVFAVAALRLRNALEAVVTSSTRGMTQALYIANLREFLEVEPVIERDAGMRTGITHGKIEIENVTFTYPGLRAPALADLSLRIEPGEIVALVGRNGAGKSTLARLLARFHDPDSGRILLDGRDLRDYSQQYLHERIGFVFQSPERFEASAHDNIAYGRWHTLLADGERVRAIAERAGVAPIIESLPNRYETRLGRQFGSTDLSLGQWQQLAIARALARDAAVLILDEPAASLDAEAEYELFCGSRRLAQGRTTILISHRFSTVSMADRIVVMDKGRIVESGTHGELLAQQGHYAALYALQQRQMALGVSDDEN